MQREQETNIEFLEKSLSNLLNRKVVAVLMVQMPYTFHC
jgi:hypothetical protein